MLIPKHRNIRLTGQAKSDLRDAIFERDGYSCVICHYKATEWHHEKRIAGLRSDTIEEGVALCKSCHTKRHSNDYNNEIKNAIRGYLNELYGTFKG